MNEVVSKPPEKRALPVLVDCDRPDKMGKLRLRPEVCGRRWALANGKVPARNAQDHALVRMAHDSPCGPCPSGEARYTDASAAPVGPVAPKPSAVHAPKRRGRPPKAKAATPAPAISRTPPLPPPAPEEPLPVVVVPAMPAVPAEALRVRLTEPARRARPPKAPEPGPEVPDKDGHYHWGGSRLHTIPRSQHRRHQVAVPLTDAEYAQLNELARKSGRSRAKWLLPHVLAAIERGQDGVVAVEARAVGPASLEERVVELEARVRKLEGGQGG